MNYALVLIFNLVVTITGDSYVSDDECFTCLYFNFNCKFNCDPANFSMELFQSPCNCLNGIKVNATIEPGCDILEGVVDDYGEVKELRRGCTFDRKTSSIDEQVFKVAICSNLTITKFSDYKIPQDRPFQGTVKSCEEADGINPLLITIPVFIISILLIVVFILIRLNKRKYTNIQSIEQF